MATDYPGAIDTFVNPISSDDLDSGSVPHAGQHADANDGIRAIQLELGTNPKGVSASVKARLDAMDTLFGGKVNTALLNVASGVATTDASNKLVQTVDASKVNSGTLAIARIPLLTSNKIDTASGAFADALIPNIAAAKTTSGVFNLSRIPGLPGNWITSGTIDAARLPSSVTANANARVVDDEAAMLAIPVVDRADGMVIIVKTPWSLWTYRADSSTFWRVSDYKVLKSVDSPSVTNSVSLFQDPHLRFTALANKAYYVTGVMMLTQDNNATGAGARAGFVVPSGNWHIAIPRPVTSVGSSASGDGNWAGILGAVNNSVGFGIDGNAGNITGVPFWGIINNGASAGTVALAWAQNVATASITTRMKAGSFLKAEMIA